MLAYALKWYEVVRLTGLAETHRDSRALAGYYNLVNEVVASCKIEQLSTTRTWSMKLWQVVKFHNFPQLGPGQ